MKRLYNVVRVVENTSMINFGKRIQLNETPMTHSEACVFLVKLTKYNWCRDFLVEVVE